MRRHQQEVAPAVRDHGGSLQDAARLFPDAPTPWIDLSTGINPHSYPLCDLPASIHARLPEPGRLTQLQAVAAKAYGGAADAIVAAPGTQILLPLVASLVEPGLARVLSPTYAEHARAAALAGQKVEAVSDVEALFEARLAVVVNPNNPDGRLVDQETLLTLAAHQRAQGGLLVVDEAFMDVGPQGASLAPFAGEGGLVVLRSFGKFFGLAGLRLGFALTQPELADRIRAWLGPWAVAGPALEIGIRALGDAGWQKAMRARLAAERARLDELLEKQDVPVRGGTDLYRFVITEHADGLFRALGARGIYVRRFADQANALRFGLPADEAAWERLALTLEHWRKGGEG